jgi:hypothetical protein
MAVVNKYAKCARLLRLDLELLLQTHLSPHREYSVSYED